MDRITGYCLIVIMLLTGAARSQNVDSTACFFGISQEHAPLFFLDFYQRYLSGLRGSNCPMYPSCSNYARMVIERYSPGLAYCLITDRLLRCGHDYCSYDDTIIDHHRRFLDVPYLQTVSVPYEAHTGESASASTTGTREADFLYDNGFHEQAYHEYLTALSVHADNTHIKKAAYAAYYAYDYPRFIREILALVKFFPEPESRGDLFLLTAKRSFKEGMYDQTFKILEKYREQFTTPVQREEYCLLHAITALYCGIDTVQPLDRNDFSPDSPLKSYAGRIDSLRIVLDNVHPRSRSLAGIVSVVLPGSGYMLGNRKGTAIFSLLCNSLLIWSTVEFVQRKSYGTAAFSALIGSGFYFGSILGSVHSVDDYNRRKRCALITANCSDLAVDP